MKKIKAIVVVFLMAMMGTQTFLVKAYSPDYLPAGKNYLSEDNFETAGEYLTTIDPFVVKPYTDYCLTVTRDYYDNGGDEISIGFYQNGSLIKTVMVDVKMEFSSIAGYNLYSYTFKTPASGNYLSLSFRNGQEVLTPNSILTMQLEEGTVSTVGQVPAELYVQGTLVDTNGPVFSGSCVVISSVDQPFSLAEIKAGITAIDSISGDVTDDIVTMTDEYTGHESQLGEYSILFQVADTVGNTTDFECTVKVVDVTDPVISGPVTKVVPWPQTLTAEDIKGLLSASDNYDLPSSLVIQMTEDLYTASSSKVGTYSMSFSVEDSSGNIGTYSLVIEVVDQESPVFTGITEMVLGYDLNMTASEIMESLEATDGYDGDLTDSIFIKDDQYATHEHEIGEYLIIFSVIDSSGNQTDKTVAVKVVDTIGPVIYYDTSVIKVYDSAVLGLEDFSSLLKRSGELDPETEYTVSVLYDSYSKFASIPGIYQMKLGFKDGRGNVITKNLRIVVSAENKEYLDRLPGIIDGNNQTFFQKYQTWIVGGGITLLAIASNLCWFFFRKKRI